MNFLKSPLFHIIAAALIGALVMWYIIPSGNTSAVKSDLKKREAKVVDLERMLVNSEKIGAAWYHKYNETNTKFRSHLLEDSIAQKRYDIKKSSPVIQYNNRDISRVLSDLAKRQRNR